jgi:hypothetical protein
MTNSAKIALAAFCFTFICGILALVAATLDAGTRLGRLEEKVDRLTSTIDTIAPPTVKFGKVTVPLGPSPFETAMINAAPR